MLITINNIECQCEDNDTILEVARRNNIQIPSICYLSNCSPTLACKMCMVEVDGKRTYSCNAKVKANMNVLSNTPEILKDRNEIMTTYCINHPLECGVCDKSGECELQDFTLMNKVDVLPYGVIESDKKTYSFAQSFYDPALCIMCERCATTCKDNIGENNLKAGKAESSAPDSIKDLMGKDPYSVFAKKQKGIIDFIGDSECKDCGECIAVCPVGAMSYKDFTYTSNAWELSKISSTCTHCAGGCELIYNVKHLDIAGAFDKIYRVQNDFLYNPICGAGRFGYDQISIGKSKVDEGFLQNIFSLANCINLGSQSSNEEIFVISQIAKYYNLKIFNKEAYRFKAFRDLFLGEFANNEINNENNASIDSNIALATFNDMDNASVFLSFETYFKNDAPSIRYKINNSLKMRKNTKLITFNMLHDNLLTKLGKNVEQVKSMSVLHSILGLVFANSLEEKFNLAFDNALENLKIQKEITKTIKIKKEIVKNNENDADSKDAQNLDSTNTQMQSENGIESENAEKIIEEVQEIKEMIECYDVDSILQNLNLAKIDSIKIAQNGVIFISQNTLELFDNDALLAKLLAFICKELNLKMLYVPKGANIIGIANLAPLSNEYDINEKYAIGFRDDGNFIFDVNLINQNDTQFMKIRKNIHQHESTFFPIHAHAQSEGTITTCENRVMAFNVALPFVDQNNQSALDISDIAGILGISDFAYLGDLSAKLDELNGAYKNLKSTDLVTNFTKSGVDNRGYYLKYTLQNIENNASLKDYVQFKNYKNIDVPNFNAILLNNQNQFNKLTKYSDNLQSKSAVYVNEAFLKKLELKENAHITIMANNIEIQSTICIDYDIKDEVFFISPLIDNIDLIFKDSLYAHINVKMHIDENTSAIKELMV